MQEWSLGAPVARGEGEPCMEMDIGSVQACFLSSSSSSSLSLSSFFREEGEGGAIMGRANGPLLMIFSPSFSFFGNSE